ncbi:MAG: SDR family oxidoreductase [Bdellovibrionota bacterium]
MPRYLVTGGAGFIGSHLVEFLLEKGADVRVLDNLSTGKKENLSHLLSNPRLELRVGDINVAADLDPAAKGCDAIFHLAALGSVARSVDDPLLTNKTNVEGSLAVFECARRLGIKRIVMAGSSSVYGDSPALPKKEDMRVEPVSPYGASKAAMELYAKAYADCYGLETVVLRYFNVYGPRQDPKSLYAAVVPAFVSAVLSGQTSQIHGDGEQSRDFTYAGDVARANFLAATLPAGKVKGEVFNIGGGERISVNQLFDKIAKAAGVSSPKTERGPARPGDVRHTLADISRAREKLGWRPEVSLDQGLSRTVESFRRR